MSMPTSLVPSRFLTLVAHFVIVINIFWSREDNVLACLPPSYNLHQYQNRDTELIVAFSVTMGMFLIELLGFFSGVSMFNSTQNLISIGAHTSASVALLFFFFEQWPCSTYWWIFTFCRTWVPYESKMGGVNFHKFPSSYSGKSIYLTCAKLTWWDCSKPAEINGRHRLLGEVLSQHALKLSLWLQYLG